MRVPSNLIKINYTSGNEYAYALSYKYYRGSYYEFNGKYFAGKEFDVNAPELIKADNSNVNTLLTQASTFVYGYISGKQINNNRPNSFIYNNQETNRYFLSKVNINPILIKEVDKNTFENFKNDSLYKSVVLSYEGGFNEKELNEAEKKMPGIKTFVNTSYIPPSTEESGLVG
jgi:hypothetical protein